MRVLRAMQDVNIERMDKKDDLVELFFGSVPNNK